MYVNWKKIYVSLKYLSDLFAIPFSLSRSISSSSMYKLRSEQEILFIVTAMAAASDVERQQPRLEHLLCQPPVCSRLISYLSPRDLLHLIQVYKILATDLSEWFSRVDVRCDQQNGTYHFNHLESETIWEDSLEHLISNSSKYADKTQRDQKCTFLCKYYREQYETWDDDGGGICLIPQTVVVVSSMNSIVPSISFNDLVDSVEKQIRASLYKIFPAGQIHAIEHQSQLELLEHRAALRHDYCYLDRLVYSDCEARSHYSNLGTITVYHAPLQQSVRRFRDLFQLTVEELLSDETGLYPTHVWSGGVKNETFVSPSLRCDNGKDLIFMWTIRWIEETEEEQEEEHPIMLFPLLRIPFRMTDQRFTISVVSWKRYTDEAAAAISLPSRSIRLAIVRYARTVYINDLVFYRYFCALTRAANVSSIATLYTHLCLSPIDYDDDDHHHHHDQRGSDYESCRVTAGSVCHLDLRRYNDHHRNVNNDDDQTANNTPQLVPYQWLFRG